MRLQWNFVSGTLGTTMTSGTTEIPPTGISGMIPDTAFSAEDSYFAVVLDPQGENNGPEIVHVVGWAGEGDPDLVTIVRAREGTTAVSHPSGENWSHNPTVHDYLPPTNPRSHSDDDDEFESTGLDDSWVRVEPATTSIITPGGGFLSVKNPGGMSASQFGAIVKPITTGAGTCFETFITGVPGGDGSNNFQVASLS